MVVHDNKKILYYVLSKGLYKHELTYDILLYSIEKNDILLAEYALMRSVDLSKDDYLALKLAVLLKDKLIGKYIIDILEKENKSAIEIIANQLSKNFDIKRNKEVLRKLIEEY